MTKKKLPTGSNEPKIIRTQMKAIRAKCLDCTCGEPKEVDLCPVEDCPLWDYRMGKTPKNVVKVNKVDLTATRQKKGE